MENSKTSFNAVCVTADVMNSRINGKDSEIESVVRYLNEKYLQNCLTPFTKRAGDELFGVVRKFSGVYLLIKDLCQLSNELDIPLYVGVGIGTVINKNIDQPHNVNGTAIWSSSDALKLLKKSDQSIRYFTNEKATFKYFINAGTSDIPYNVLNYMIALIFEKINGRTKKQTEVIAAVEKSPNLTLEEIGRRIGYKRNAGQSISNILMRADYNFVFGAERELINLLEHIQKERS